MRTAGLILAAGASRRFGSPKQLASIDGERLLERAVRICRAADLSPTLVILGAHSGQIQKVCDLHGARVEVNAAWETGAASSIRAGITALQGEGIDAAIVMTCDMPFVTAEHLQALAARAELDGMNVGSKSKRWEGVPACFLRTSFADLLKLEGDSGAKKLLLGAPWITLASGADVDTIEELAAAADMAGHES